MPSFRARIFSAGYRALIRRGSWGADERAVARRARRLFGAPPPLGWARSRGLTVEPTSRDGVSGEWLTPRGTREPPRGVLLYIHGGGFVSCSAATHRPVTSALARLTNSRVFSLEYRLAPEHRFPAALDDAVNAYRWLLGQGLGGEEIALAGDSAGGGLVLSTLVRARDEGLPRPACAVCFSPWADLTGSGASVRSNDGRCVMFRAGNIAEFAPAYLGGASPRDPHASPAFAELDGLPPVLLQVGSTELLLDDSVRVHERIQEAARRSGRDEREASRLEIYEDVPHCWQMLDGFVPEARRSIERAAEFIRGHVRAAERR